MANENAHSMIDSLIYEDIRNNQFRNNQPLIDLPIINPMPVISALGNITGISSFLANPLKYLTGLAKYEIGTGLLFQEPGHGKAAQFTEEGRDSLAFENLLKELEFIDTQDSLKALQTSNEN